MQSSSPSVIPDRASPEIVSEQYEIFVGTHCRDFFDTLPVMIFALNKHRQVVFANMAAVSFLGLTKVEEVLGKRPGEALSCVNAALSPGGCGTSRHCRKCGAARALLTAVEGAVGSGECKLLRRENEQLEGLDLNVNASPLCIGERQYVIFSVTDVSHEMRRRSMERIFFHDVLNLAGGISGLVELLVEEVPPGSGDMLPVLSSATRSLVDEILAQRELLAAESNELTVATEVVSTKSLLSILQRLYATSPAAQGQEIKLADAADEMVSTDRRLAQRVLGNMIKNALEAGLPGDSVALGCKIEGSSVCFTVHNRAYIPRDVQDSIFHRRFSTKSASRGLGTYSMLLLTERYLHGEVGFESDKSAGTTFYLRLPKRHECG
ncbi:PAS domain-containing sensor histidine kinase [Humidesulfovibrio sp.]